MMLLLCLSVLIATVVGKNTPACSAGFNTGMSEAKKNTVLGEDIQQFMQKFHSVLLESLNTGPTNVVYSPTSMVLALAMLTEGADSHTREILFQTVASSIGELEQSTGKSVLAAATTNLMQLLGQSDNDYSLSIANGLFVEKTFSLKPDYQSKIQSCYKAEVQGKDFKENAGGAEGEINQWVEDKTNGKIKDLLSGLDSETKMVIANAVHFKAKWASQFYKDATTQKPFKRSDGETVQVPMMHESFGHHDSFMYAESNDFQIFGMPYRTGDYKPAGTAMYFILPKKESTNIRSINYQDVFDLIRQSSDSGISDADVSIPKFKIEQEAEFAKLLKTMGLENIFTNAADFSKIAERPVKVSDAFHKAFIQVDEEGTEAAAATAFKIVPMSAMIGGRRITFNANRPFGYVLMHDEAQAPLFVGFVENPQI